MAQTQSRTATTQEAREGRSRMVRAMRQLEDALAAASTTRERRWVERVTDALWELQNALKETREAADTKGSLLDDLVQEYPRLFRRAERLRAEYDRLQKLVESLVQSTNEDSAETLRQRLGDLLLKLRAVQAQETELIFEAFHVDIGVGD